MKSRWVSGNSVQLLENGEAYYPAVFDAIRQAQREVVVETFILFEDKVGNELHALLIDAARRGVQVDMLVDGFGSSDLTSEFVGSLTAAGVRLQVFDPASRWFGKRINVLRRMHRKIVVVDAELAFVGGINFSLDHLREFGREAKQDYAVQVRGPIVAQIHAFVRGIAEHDKHAARAAQAVTPPQAQSGAAGSADMMFVTRDNHQHRNDIERHYRAAIRSARERVVLANAYFFPGYLLLREMRRAARRGVKVTLILQGEPDMPIVKTAASLLYGYLQRSGVRICEYCERPLHGKVAVVDGQWSTVGSSNLDPLSLSLNLEANLVIRDRTFTQHLAERLEQLVIHSCRDAEPEPPAPTWAFWRPLRSFLVFHFVRGFSSWVGLLPRHSPQVLRAGGQPPARAVPVLEPGDGRR